MEDRVMLKGSVALAEGALAAGCRYYFGYPITPQNDIPEYLSMHMRDRGGVFIQAESEIASINMLLGAAAAGARTMTSSSGPGISLMQEGLSYMAGSELPCVVVNITRSGPGLGGISATQGDYNQATCGGGHGDYSLIVLAPSSVQEMYDLAIKAFELADKYRNPAMILGDAILGQMKEPVLLVEPKSLSYEKPWALTGAKGRKPQRVKSLYLQDGDMEVHNLKLAAKYRRLAEEDTMVEVDMDDGAEIAVVAFGSCARIVISAVDAAREEGMRVAYVRPITLFPFPSAAIRDVSSRVGKVLTVEMNTGQMVRDVRLAAAPGSEVHLLAKPGGALPTPQLILEEMKKLLRQGAESK
ncbi:MAG: 3-methyl-2-oxobutanoate dehydrogenase subunit VorB [Dethiobacter sp.]|jgi:2-oxoglutarate ferredoxin oxidoreductase subunit alpha|nr:3-methyl-2-oxobutanoate dehydrogenase subunit VorB [Dethiobacter sp.]